MAHPIMLVLFASGLLTYSLGASSGTFVQWNAIGHASLGLLGLVILPLFMLQHIRRTVGLRKPGVMISGVILSGVIACLMLSGAHIAIYSRQEARQWVFDTHVFAALGAAILCVVHIGLDQWRRYQGLQTVKPKAARILNRDQNLRSASLLATYLLLILAASIGHDAYRKSPAAPPQVSNYAYDYGEHPFRPSQTETSVEGHFISKDFLASSQQCGACHQEIYQQWQASLHAQAASDPTYVRNVSLLADNVGISATRYCEGCHAPVALLSGELSPGGQHGGIGGSLANIEGIGCVGCHGIDRLVHLQGVASYQWSPSNHYLFEGYDHPLARLLRQTAIRLLPQQHRQQMAKPLLKEPKLCATCHEQFMDESMNKWGWVKMQTDYSHWLDSPYSGQGTSRFSETTVSRCQDCHFPMVRAADPSADRDGKVRSHRSPGANTAIPWLQGDFEQLQTTQEFLQSGRVLINIEQPHRQDAPQNQFFVEHELRPGIQDTGVYFLYLGERAKLQASVSNRAVGHQFPGGTTDINEAWIHFRVSDASGKVVYESGAIDPDGVVDQQAHIYQSKPIDREGRHVWRHDLFRMVGESYSNLIAAGETDIRIYEFEVPYWAKGPLSVSATLRYRKFNQRYAQWALQDENIRLPVVEMSHDYLNIPLRERNPVERFNQ